MPNQAASSPNLEFYRKAAKSLLKSVRSGDPAALGRFARFWPGAGGPPALHQAQRVIAREQGFATWPRFRAFLLESALDLPAALEKFVDAALDHLHRAEGLLARHREIEGAGFFVDLLLGDVSRVRRAISGLPDFATQKGGPRNWEPLTYVCFSRFSSPESSRAPGLVATARLLLDHGADPNGSYFDERWPDFPMPCLYGASGLNNNVELTRLLLDAGARPDDGESLYHSTEHADLACFRLLLERGAAGRATDVLNHMLDREALEGVRLLLAAGADPNRRNQRGETSLHWAVWRGRSASVIEMLLDAGAEIDARRLKDGRTAYAMAVQSGQMATADLLASRGADTTVTALDRFLGDCAGADPASLERLVAAAPEKKLPDEYVQLLPDLASNHRTSAVRALLAAGVAVDTMGADGCTALHWACWKGYADLVKILLDHGASLSIEDHTYHATPPGWLDHGRENAPPGDSDYLAVEQLLIAAGAKTS